MMLVLWIIELGGCTGYKINLHIKKPSAQNPSAAMSRQSFILSNGQCQRQNLTNDRMKMWFHTYGVPQIAIWLLN